VSAVVGDRFPAFELADLDGRVWRLADIVGDRTVIFCFASW
jgi:peroxiredoxin